MLFVVPSTQTLPGSFREKYSFTPHIPLPEGLPGISSAFAFRPDTAKPATRARGKLAERPEFSLCVCVCVCVCVRGPKTQHA